MRTIQVAALNVVMPSPHSADRYVDLFRKTFKLREYVSLRGDFVGMLGALSEEKNFVTGYFYKFFNLDVREGWFNLNRRQEADPDELSQIRVPEYLKPHHQSIRFIFFPRLHRLIFVSKDKKESLSPAMARTMLHRLFSDERLVKQFGEIEITVEPEREQLRRIFALPRLKELTMEISPPNPDDLEEAQRDVMERMNAERAQKMLITLKSKHPKGLEPDQDHKNLAKIAQSNGSVWARGENEHGAVVNMSTADHPLVEHVKFNPNVQTLENVLNETAGVILQRIRD